MSALTNLLKDAELLRNSSYSGGKWWNGGSGEDLEVTDPYTQELVATVRTLSVAEVREVINESAEAFKSWRQCTARERADILHAWHAQIRENIDDLAVILTAEQGKPLAESRGEILANAEYLRWFAEEARRVYGDVVPAGNANNRIVVLKQPVGVCGAITPWNFPSGMITRKAGPALAAGCTIIVKPAARTPLSALALAECAHRAGVPAGVFSVIIGDAKDIGTEFCTNGKIAKLSFTGSTQVGRWLMQHGAQTLKKLSLELGGNAPFIVFDDAHVDEAVEGAMVAKFRNSGQTCVSANRIYVQEGIYESFVKKLSQRMEGLKVGSGMDADTDLGPLIDAQAVDKVESHIADALERGAKLVLGGKRHALGGTFFEPTLLSSIQQSMRVAHEETFGPLAPVVAFEHEAEVVRMANDTEYGLASYFYSTNLGRVWRVAEALECGIVGVNSGLIANETAPFGGVKQSGFGREGSKYGIGDYLDIKYVCMSGINA